MNACIENAAELSRAVEGVNWDAAATQRSIEGLHEAWQNAPPPDRAQAFDLILRRIDRASVDDADGVAYLALTAGTLVERGADAADLAQSLLPKLPEVLVAARRSADSCLEEISELETEDEEDAAWDQVVVAVDHRPISRELLRTHLELDRAGGVALAYLEKWILPAVAALSRHRESLMLARASRSLVEAAAALRESPARWLHALLVCELEARWNVLCPPQSRGFELVLDGISDNFTLHELVAEALRRQGVPGTSLLAKAVGLLRGRRKDGSGGGVRGSFNFYDHRGASFDLNEPNEVPQDFWVWNEGIPADIRSWQGRKVLLAGPPPYERTWNEGPTFSSLKSSVEVIRELPRAEYDEWMARLSPAE